jgi:hypothetical protein
MIRKFYSKIEKDKLLHLIFSPDDEINNKTDDVVRVNIAPDNEFLQSAYIRIKNKNQRFRPHIHKEIKRESNITQEAWLVLNGLIKVTYYDLDGSFLSVSLLYPGWLTMTFAGGHTYESLEKNTESIEFKLGPYSGQYDDKEFIKE